MKRPYFSKAAGAAYFRVPSRVTHLIPIVACAMLAAGCGQENELGRLPFSGTVTLDGEPLADGSISFVPVKPGEGTTRSGATIKDGKFKVDTLDGLPAGKYVVRISSAGEGPALPEDQPPGASRVLAKELIPSGWSSQSEHTITIEEGKENHFEFPVKTSG